MGPNSKIEFKGGTLYFAPIDGTGGGVVGTLDGLEEVNMAENAVEAAEVPVYINKIINAPVEFEATCEIKFRGLVKLIGFWPAVKWEINRIMIRIKRYLNIVSPSGR